VCVVVFIIINDININNINNNNSIGVIVGNEMAALHLA